MLRGNHLIILLIAFVSKKNHVATSLQKKIQFSHTTVVVGVVVVRKMATTTTLWDPTAIRKTQQKVVSLRKTIAKGEQEINEAVKKGTELEFKNLQLAHENYVTKRNQILQSREVQEKVERLEDTDEQLQTIMQDVQKQVHLYMKQIHRNKALTEEQKRQQCEELNNKVAEALLTPDQLQQMKQLQALASTLFNRLGGVEVTQGSRPLKKSNSLI